MDSVVYVRARLNLLCGSMRVCIVMGARVLPRSSERLIWRTPKETRKKQGATAWPFHFKLASALVELCAACGSNRRLYTIWVLWRLPPRPCVSVRLKTGCSLARVFSASAQQIIAIAYV